MGEREQKKNNLLEVLFRTCDSVAGGFQSLVSGLVQGGKGSSGFGDEGNESSLSRQRSGGSDSNALTVSVDEEISVEPSHEVWKNNSFWKDKEPSKGPVPKEDLGRATWTLLHTIGARFPDEPSKQQRRDVKELMTILGRLYPCKECADHFKEILKTNPVQTGSQAELSLWLCHVHNVVNRSIGKPIFPCQRVDARWGKQECDDPGCDLQGSSKF